MTNESQFSSMLWWYYLTLLIGLILPKDFNLHQILYRTYNISVIFLYIWYSENLDKKIKPNSFVTNIIFPILLLGVFMKIE